MPIIVVIGASSDRSKFGNKCVRAYASKGYHVYPVNPKEEIIENWPAFKSILEVPAGKVDRVSLYLPAAIGLKVLDDVAKRNVAELWVNPGADAPEVMKRARELGLNVIRGCSIVAIGSSPSDFN